MTAFLRPSDGFDDECPEATPGQVKAAIDYYGPTDLVKALEQKNANVLHWFKGVENPRDLALRLSPLHYVRSGLPPVLMIHGDADEMVPYEDSIKLRDALTAAQVPMNSSAFPVEGMRALTGAMRILSASNAPLRSF